VKKNALTTPHGVMDIQTDPMKAQNKSMVYGRLSAPKKLADGI